MSDAVDRMVSSRTANSTLRGVASSLSPLVGRRKADWLVGSDDELGTLREHLSEILGQSLRLSVAVGPPRPNRKPVVRCYAGDDLIAVAKLGPETHTKAMVENEARWLAEFMLHPLENVVTPEVIHSGTYGTSALLVMASLDLADDLGVALHEMPTASLAAFIRERVEESTVAETDWWHGLGSRLGNAQASLKPFIDRVDRDPFFAHLEVSAWHGDWSPWNTGQTVDGKLAIWDWERAAVGMPTGLDLLHLHYQYGAGLSGATLELASMGIPTSHHRVLQGLYLLELCARHSEADAMDSPRQREVEKELKALADDWS